MIDARRLPLAEQDLIDIWRYSFERWGEVQANKYIDALDEAVERLRVHPESGPECSFIRPDYRRIRVGAHHLYTRLLKKGSSSFVFWTREASPGATCPSSSS